MKRWREGGAATNLIKYTEILQLSLENEGKEEEVEYTRHWESRRDRRREK